jgi:hypothetical protein|tara:strand:- start:435 stop:662 length:228 start_codon:yes stop_codon:yes gene_type:complete
MTDPLRMYRRKNNALFFKKYKNNVSHEEIKEKTEEFLKRGGKIDKLQPLDALVPDAQVIHESDRERWINEGWNYP